MDSGTTDTSQHNNTPDPDRPLPPWREQDRRFLADYWSVQPGDHLIAVLLGATISERYAQHALDDAILIAARAFRLCSDCLTDYCRVNDTFVIHVPSTHPNDPCLLADSVASHVQSHLTQYPGVAVSAAASQVDHPETNAYPSASRARAAAWFAAQRAA